MAQVEVVGGAVLRGDGAGVGGDGELGQAQLGDLRASFAAQGDQPVAPAGDRYGAGLRLRIDGVQVAPGEQAVQGGDVVLAALLDRGLLGEEEAERGEVRLKPLKQQAEESTVALAPVAAIVEKLLNP